MITERMIKEIRKGEIVKTRKYVYWAQSGVILRADRALEGTIEYRYSIVAVGELL